MKNIYHKILGHGESHASKAYRPFGRKRGDWEARYASGLLKKYRGLDEVARYGVIVGYCSYFKQPPAILDIGCGEGILQERLHHSYERYVGIDYSDEAIRRASGKQDEKTVFIAADASSHSLDEGFDIIVFNECLYYLEDPLAIVRKYESTLQADGIFVVSMYEHLKSHKIWEILDAHYAEVDDVRVVQEKKTTWTIKVFVPSRQASG